MGRTGRIKPQASEPVVTLPYRTLRRLAAVLRWVGLAGIALPACWLLFSLLAGVFSIWSERASGNFASDLLEMFAPAAITAVPVGIAMAGGVLVLALSETVKLLIDLADNTRRTAEALEAQLLMRGAETEAARSAEVIG